MIKGVIFDLDGTLIDSMDLWSRIDVEFLAENGVSDPPEDISDKIKKTTVEGSARFFIEEFGVKKTVPEIIARIKEMAEREYRERIELKPCAAELIGFLRKRGIPCCVATANYNELAEAVLERNGVADGIDFVLADNEYPQGKNFPDIFLGAAERLGTAPEETLVVEDCLHCIETASAAGFVTAAIYDEASAGDAEALRAAADYYFPSLGELADTLAEALSPERVRAEG